MAVYVVKRPGKTQSTTKGGNTQSVSRDRGAQRPESFQITLEPADHPLDQVDPVVVEMPVDQLVPAISQALGAPVVITSSGPTAADKQWWDIENS